MRRLLGNVFLEYRNWLDGSAVTVLVVAFVLVSHDHGFDARMTSDLRGQLYGSLATTAGALLGFVLAGLAILVALPSGERIERLRAHHSWPRVPSSYFRAAAGLLFSLIACTLGIALDASSEPWVPYEAVVVGLLAFALSRVIGAIVALDQILAVSQQQSPLQPNRIHDP